MFQDEVADFLQGRVVFEDIHLVQHKDDFLAPGENAFEELALALGQGMIGGGDEQDQVTARDEFIGQPFVLADDGIRAGRINNVQFLQERQGIGEDGETFVHHLFGGLFAPLDQRDARGGGSGAFSQDLLAEQGVDQGALAGVELTGDDDQEEFVQLQDGFLQAVQGFARQIELGQGELHPGQGFFFVAQELGLLIGKEIEECRGFFVVLVVVTVVQNGEAADGRVDLSTGLLRS